MLLNRLSYEAAVSITPSDTVAIAHPSGQAYTRAIYVGGAGNVTVLMADGSTQTFTAPPVGTILPICVKRVNATLTTATLLIALY